MTLDAALNLLWAAIGVAALIVLAISERHLEPGSETGRMRRILAVLLVTVSLFPCVSATDDQFCFSLLQSHLGKHGGVGAPLPEDSAGKTTQHLARVLQAFDHSPVSAPYSISVIFCFLGLILSLSALVCGRDRLCRPGRAPPCPSLAA